LSQAGLEGFQADENLDIADFKAIGLL